MKNLLLKLNACSDARDWAADKDFETIWETCHRGDWMLWLAKKVGVNKRVLTLAKCHCANTVRHLMKDELSINAVDVAIKYGNGEASESELAYAASAAAAAAYAASAADDAAAYAAYAAAYAAASAADAAAASAAYAAYAAADAASSAYAASSAARKASQKATADICRKYLTNAVTEKITELLK